MTRTTICLGSSISMGSRVVCLILSALAQGKSAGKSNQITISAGRDVCVRT